MVAARVTKHVEGSEPPGLPTKKSDPWLRAPILTIKKIPGDDWIGNHEHTENQNTEVEHS
jgi:hypothetical protein